MSEDIQFVGDDNGVAIIGKKETVADYLMENGLTDLAQPIKQSKLAKAIKTTADFTEGVSQVIKESGMYIKLTPESAEDLKNMNLIPTKQKGIKYATLGKPGQVKKWLRIDDRLPAKAANPAMLSGVGALLSQQSKENENQEIVELLKMLDSKLDDIRRSQRNEKLAKLDSVAVMLDEAMTVRDHDGDTETSWEKITDSSRAISQVQNNALRELNALADKVTEKTTLRDLKKIVPNIEQESGLWIAVLSRCFQLQNEYDILELEHVAKTHRRKLEKHRVALSENSFKRHEQITSVTSGLIEKMSKADGIAKENIILHSYAARNIVSSISNIDSTVNDFHRALNIESTYSASPVRGWHEAIHDSEQLKHAGKEIAKDGAGVLGTIASAGLLIAGVGQKKSK